MKRKSNEVLNLNLSMTEKSRDVTRCHIVDNWLQFGHKSQMPKLNGENVDDLAMGRKNLQRLWKS